MTTPTNNPTHPAAGEELIAEVRRMLSTIEAGVNSTAISLAYRVIADAAPTLCNLLTAERQKREAVEKERDEARVQNDYLRLSEERIRGYMTIALADILKLRRSREGKGHMCEYRKCCDALYDHLAHEDETRKIEQNPYGRIVRERDTLKARVAELEREVGVWKAREATCHCGLRISQHGILSECAGVENKELCPHAEQVIELRSDLTTLRQELEAAKKENERLSKQNEGFRMALSGTEGLLADSTARVEALTKALEFYADMTRLEVPEGWDYHGMGGGPDLSQMVEADIGEVARAALTASAPTDAGQASIQAVPVLDNDECRTVIRHADAGAESAKAGEKPSPRRSILHWIKEWFELDGIREDGVPHHDCEFASNPECGRCEFHEMWGQLMADISATPPETTEVRAVEPHAEQAESDDSDVCESCGQVRPIAGSAKTPVGHVCAECVAKSESEVGKEIRSEDGGHGGPDEFPDMDPAAIAPGHNPDKPTNEESEARIGDPMNSLERSYDGGKTWHSIMTGPGELNEVVLSHAKKCGWSYRRRVTPSEGKGAK